MMAMGMKNPPRKFGDREAGCANTHSDYIIVPWFGYIHKRDFTKGLVGMAGLFAAYMACTFGVEALLRALGLI